MDTMSKGMLNDSRNEARLFSSMFDPTPDTKAPKLFGAILSAVALGVYILTLGGIFSRYLPIGSLSFNSQEFAFIWTVIVSNILLIFIVSYFLFSLVRAQFKAMYWYQEHRRILEGIDTVSKAKVVHCKFVQHAHSLYSTYIEAQLGQITTPRLGLWVNQLKSTFDQYSSSGQCAVSIKLFEAERDSSRKLKTAVRDDVSKLIRSRTDRSPRLSLYDANENTAFVEIMSPAHEDWFICNDLAALGDAYQNSNPRWHRYYNSTIVAPIKPVNGDVNKTTVGFICVDSKKGIFDQDVSVLTLVFFCNLLYDHLQATLTNNPHPQRKRS